MSLNGGVMKRLTTLYILIPLATFISSCSFGDAGTSTPTSQPTRLSTITPTISPTIAPTETATLTLTLTEMPSNTPLPTDTLTLPLPPQTSQPVPQVSQTPNPKIKFKVYIWNHYAALVYAYMDGKQLARDPIPIHTYMFFNVPAGEHTFRICDATVYKTCSSEKTINVDREGIELSF